MCEMKTPSLEDERFLILHCYKIKFRSHHFLRVVKIDHSSISNAPLKICGVVTFM
jgi:hypothetical protein